eukprot:IDg10399t1
MLFTAVQCFISSFTQWLRSVLNLGDGMPFLRSEINSIDEHNMFITVPKVVSVSLELGTCAPESSIHCTNFNSNSGINRKSIDFIMILAASPASPMLKKHW